MQGSGYWASEWLVLLSLTPCHSGAASSSVAWLPNSPALQSCYSRDAVADRNLLCDSPVMFNWNGDGWFALKQRQLGPGRTEMELPLG